MDVTRSEPGWVNCQQFNDNRCRASAEMLAQYAGQHVAWNREGTRILVGDADLTVAIAKLHAAGIPICDVVWSWVPGLPTDSLLPSLQDAVPDTNGHLQ